MFKYTITQDPAKILTLKLWDKIKNSFKPRLFLNTKLSWTERAKSIGQGHRSSAFIKIVNSIREIFNRDAPEIDWSRVPKVLEMVEPTQPWPRSDSSSVQGFTGATGFTGSRGLTGIAGFTGSRGLTGVWSGLSPYTQEKTDKCIFIAKNTIQYGFEFGKDIEQLATDLMHLSDRRNAPKINEY